MTLGQQIAVIESLCLPHIHFSIYAGGFAAADGDYPYWLFGYLPNNVCPMYPTAWPGRYVDPVPFVLEHTAVEARSWSRIKTLYR